MKKIFFLSFLLLGLIGCVSKLNIKTAVLQTPQTITAMDGSFVIKSNQPFTISSFGFSGDEICLASRYFTNAGSHNKSLNRGAKKVKIDFNDGQPSLFGVLEFCGIWDNGNIRRQYTIVIPKDRIQQARQGRVSLVYQETGGTFVQEPCFFCNYVRGPALAWSLWLSNRPF